MSAFNLNDRLVDFVCKTNGITEEQVKEMWDEYHKLIKPALDLVLPMTNPIEMLANHEARVQQTRSFFKMKVEDFKQKNKQNKTENPDKPPKRGKKGRKQQK